MYFLSSNLGRNVYIIESAIKTLIYRSSDPEIQSILLAQYVPNDQFGPYVPFNLPHLIPHRSSSAFVFYVSLFIALLVILPILILYFGIQFALIRDLWVNPQFGIWSKALCIYLYAVTALTISYIVIVRVRVPIKDWSKLHLLELTEQFNPERLDDVRDQVFGDVERRRSALTTQGYRVPIRSSEDIKRARRQRILFWLSTLLLLFL